MRIEYGISIFLLFFIYGSTFAQDQCEMDGCRLSRDESFFIVAPRKIHPNQIVQISVSITNLYYKQIQVRTLIKRNDVQEIASATRVFNQEGTNIMQLWIPISAKPGDYKLRVEGTQSSMLGAGSAAAGYIFENETSLIFDTKQLSVFIMLNKPFYRQGQTVYFRIMPVMKNLMSRSGSMDVYAIDATGSIVRRWLSQQTNAGGVLNMKFPLSEQPAYGEWKIRAIAFGHTYEKAFDVNEYYVTTIDVNVSMPLYHFSGDFGIAGIMSANLTLGQPARGTSQIRAEIRLPLKDRDPNVTYEWPYVEKPKRYFSGVEDFMITMRELREANGGKSIANHEVYIVATVHDWFRAQSTTGASTTVIYSEMVDLKVMGDKARTFKPGQQMDVYYALVNADGTPLSRNQRQVTINKIVQTTSRQTTSAEIKLLADDSGIVHFRWIPEEDSLMLQLSAWYDSLTTRTVEITAYRHYSPTNSYIHVTSSTQKPVVNEYMIFTVATNTFVDKVYYLITSGGNIVTGSFLKMTSQQKTFSIALSRDMIPEAHIVVWHIYHGEVIADSLNFFVNGTRLNYVDIGFNRGKDFTGDTVEVKGTTDPSAYIGAAVLDAELWSYGWNTFITETDINRELASYEPHVNKSFSHLWKLPHEQEHVTHFPASTYGIDANTTFEYAGLIVFTDANVTRIFHTCNETLGFRPCMDGTCFTEVERCDGVRQCMDGQDEMGCDFFEVKNKFTLPKHRLGLVARHYVEDATWLWGGHFVMPNGRIDVKVHVPDEPIAWVLGGIAISRNLGFGVIHHPHMHQSTRSFYMRLEAPTTEIVKGEQIGIRAALFNYWDQDLEVIVMLHDSDKYRFIVVEEFGIVSQYAPRTIRGDVQSMEYLESRKVYEMLYPVLPIVDGCFTVTISAKSFLYSDTESLELCTKYDGVTSYMNTPYFIDLVESGSLTLPDLEIPVPDRFVEPEARKHLFVPGSPVAKVAIVGDVVGPGFFEPYLNAENTLNKPYGGAENNMYNFAYNLYYVLYLKATNQLKLKTLRTALDGMNLGLQRQMGYMNEDGSFSMFRDYREHTPSVWVTSFVLSVLHDANQKDWETEYFHIPITMLNKIASWICKQRSPEGYFIETGPVYSSRLKSRMALTSYVLMVFSQATGLTGAAETCKTDAINDARQYIENRWSKVSDPYTVSLMAYALDLSGSSKATGAFNKLKSIKRQGGHVYWADKPIPENNITVIDGTQPFYQPRTWYSNEGYAVEATAYALLLHLRRNHRKEARPIMTWLQVMRNTFAGQASTHDTIMALKALSVYAKRDTNRALYNMRFELMPTSLSHDLPPDSTNHTAQMNFDRNNWIDLQEYSVARVWGSVRGTVQGTGMAIMTLGTWKNVEYPDQIWPKSIEKFFEVDLVPSYKGRNDSILFINSCARWTRPDISNQSGMAVMEIHIPTGYIITNDVLRLYAQSGIIPTMHRAEATDRKVVFYFDHLEGTQTCVNFRLDRWYPVANMTKQHYLKVYEYYEPGRHNTTLYETNNLYHLHICQVCGSFQCPYCPFYNTAPIGQMCAVLSLLIATCSFVLSEMCSSRRWL